MTVVTAAYPLAHVGCGAVGGAETIASAIESAVAARGDRSILIAREGSSARGTLVPIPARDGPIDEAARHEASLLMRRAIEYVLAQFNVDVVHLHGFDFGTYVPASEVPTIVTLHLPVEWYPVTTLKAMADRVHYVCVSGSQHRSAASFGLATALVENGVSLFSAAPVTRHHYVVALGRICPEKGFHEALDAAALANVELVLAGRTFSFREHERYFKEVILPRLDGRRRFVGPVNRAEKIRLIGRARALLVPSRAPETSSLVAMEALALGTPVIAYPSGALSEIVEHGTTGFIVRDVNEMAAAIRAAGVIDPDACRRAAAVRFSGSRMVDEYLALYERITIGRERAEACA
jgi:glycosyltransferase involved in cell wall biosynthesis